MSVYTPPSNTALQDHADELARHGRLAQHQAASPALTDSVTFIDLDTGRPARCAVSEMLAIAGQITGLTSATPLAADSIAFSDASDSDALKKATIGDIPVAQSQVAASLVQVASDGAAAILSTTRAVLLAASTTGTKAISTTSSYSGQVIDLRLVAASGGSYTLAVDGGTLTLDAANESARVIRSGSSWYVIGLDGATVV